MKNRKALGWGEFILGILLIIIGIYTLIKPYSTIRGVTFIYGLAALITSIIDIIFMSNWKTALGFLLFRHWLEVLSVSLQVF